VKQNSHNQKSLLGALSIIQAFLGEIGGKKQYYKRQ